MIKTYCFSFFFFFIFLFIFCSFVYYFELTVSHVCFISHLAYPDFPCYLRQMNRNIKINFRSYVNISHCAKCECYAQSRIICSYINADRKEVIICKNCQYAPGDHCQYCTIPGVPNKIIKANSSYTHSIYPCVRCYCDIQGTLSCSYEVSKMNGEISTRKSCRSLDDCKDFIEKIHTGKDKKYKCQTCSYNGAIKSSRSQWIDHISGTEVNCLCSNYGNVQCSHHASIMDLSFEIHCYDCTYTKLLETFQSKGRHLAKL